MRLPGDIDCGCDNRRDIMFTQGRPARTELLLLAGGIALVALAYYINRNGGH